MKKKLSTKIRKFKKDAVYTGDGIEKDIKKVEEKIINIPNFFTTLRIIITFVIIYAVFTGVDIVTIAILFVVGMITDAIDGNVARIFNIKTEFGRKYDMLADRFLLVGTILSVVIHYSMTGYFRTREIIWVFIIMSRELVSFPAVLWAFFFGDITPKVRVIGKATTVLQAISFPAVVLKLSFAWYLVIITGVVGLISGIRYNRDAKAKR